MTNDDLNALQIWVGREVRTEEWLHPTAPRQLAATFDLDLDTLRSHELPPLWQLLYGLDASSSASLGDDGAQRASSGSSSGGLPPVPMAEVMWAGADYRFDAPLRTHAPATRRSHVTQIKSVQGRQGPLVFVSVANEWSQDGRLAVIETTHAVFMDAAPTARGTEPAPAVDVVREAAWPMDEVRLFRFSALTCWRRPKIDPLTAIVPIQI